ncbi:spermidine synthase [Herbiconiux sp. P15]|uniref:spermidine synthase n=1 Tax=Herbiconiux liukaitaii TaxID=3342799 RepID=UPI0035BA44A5
MGDVRGLEGRFELESGRSAGVAVDPLVPGSWVLSIEGVDQSHVDLGDPGSLFYDYVRRIGAVIDRIDLPGRPITVVHLGAGALTLARYVQATRPGSAQLVVEYERGLVDAVLERLPVPAGTHLTLREGDAAAVVADLIAPDGSAQDGGAWAGRADLVVDDLYSGLTTPAHLTTPEWYSAVGGLLGPRGMLVVNVADDDGLPGVRSRLAAIAPALPYRLVLGPTSVLTDAQAGNAVILASRDPAVLDLADDLRRGGPHPSAVLDAHDLPFPGSAAASHAPMPNDRFPSGETGDPCDAATPDDRSPSGGTRGPSDATTPDDRSPSGETRGPSDATTSATAPVTETPTRGR